MQYEQTTGRAIDFEQMLGESSTPDSKPFNCRDFDDENQPAA